MKSRFRVKAWCIGMPLAMLAMLSSPSAHAADGCKFLLCIAGPWASISQCVPTVREVFRDLARGRSFPTCSMSGAGNSANNTWVNQRSCPSMYRQHDWETGSYVGCTYPGRISVYVNGALWSQVFWDVGGNTSTWYSDTARTSLTERPDAAPLDEVFRNDLNLWNAMQVDQCRSRGGTAEFDQFNAFQRCNYPYWGEGG